jgi:4-amino-4-deoxy-L-arabinose transferase-like glycosyltransferase
MSVWVCAPRVRRTAFLALLALAFALRVFQLGAPALWWDESLSVYRATRDLGTVLANTILIQTIVTTDTVPQGYFLILHFLVRAFGISEFALRFFSAAINVATIPLLYALARRWLNHTAAWLTALLATLSPFYVRYAQEARPYTLVLFWSVLALYALTRALAEFKIQGSQFTFHVSRFTFHVSRFTFHILIYLLAATAALYTHYYALFLLPVHALWILILAWRTPRRRWLCFLPALTLAAALFLVPQVLTSMAGNVGMGPVFVPLDVILRDLLNSFSVGVTLEWADAWWIDTVMLALFALGIALANSKSKIQDSRSPTFFEFRFSVLTYLFIPILGVFAFSFIRPLYQNSRYLIAISPAFYLGIAAGLDALARRRRALAAIALIVFAYGAILSLRNGYFEPRYGKEDHRAWAESLRERAQRDDALILDSPHTEELYRYYADDVVPFVTLPILRADRQPSPDADRAAVRALLQHHARVWYLAMHVPFDDPDARIEKYLNEEGVLLDRAEFAGTSTALALSLYARALPLARATDIATPLDFPFAGHLRLRGFDAPIEAPAGARLVVRLYWMLDEPVGEDYAVSLRLVNDAETRIGQWDAIPLGNRSGSSTWLPQHIIVETREIALARTMLPGTYRWQVVPYHSATGNPLGEVVTLQQIQIIEAK